MQPPEPQHEHEHEQEQEAAELCVQGTAYEILDAASSSLAVAVALQRAEAESISRFDVRCSLEPHELALIEREKRQTDFDYARETHLLSHELADALEHERYVALHQAELRAAQTAESVQALASRLQSQFESRIKAIKERSAAQAAEADAAEVTFKPSFDVPPQMPLPQSLCEHSLIEKTAWFARTKGKQAELLLQVRQSSNPEFEFLRQNARLHPYYCLLRDSGLKHSSLPPASGSGLGLASEYASSSSSSGAETDEVLEGGVSPTSSRVISSLCQRVREHGLEFFDAVLQKQSHSKRFEFLLPTHRYHQHFRDELRRHLSIRARTQPPPPPPPPPLADTTPPPPPAAPDVLPEKTSCVSNEAASEHSRSCSPEHQGHSSREISRSRSSRSRSRSRRAREHRRRPIRRSRSSTSSNRSGRSRARKPGRRSSSSTSRSRSRSRRAREHRRRLERRSRSSTSRSGSRRARKHRRRSVRRRRSSSASSSRSWRARKHRRRPVRRRSRRRSRSWSS